MRNNHIRDTLSERLEVVALKCDIKRMSAEMEYHKSKAEIFDETIKAQQIDLENILGIRQVSPPKVGVYS